MGSTIPNEKAPDAFQSQLSDLLGAQMTLTPKISLWPQNISPDYSGKPRFSSLEICTQKRISQQNEQSISQEAMALQPPGRGTGNGDKARPFQGAAGALRALSLAQHNPPWRWPKSGSGEGGPAVELPELGLPGPGARQDGKVAPFSPAPAAATDRGPLPLASPPRHPHPASQQAPHLAEAPAVVQR